MFSTSPCITVILTLLLHVATPRQHDWSQLPLGVWCLLSHHIGSWHFPVPLCTHQLSILGQCEGDDGLIESNLGDKSEECLELRHLMCASLMLLLKHFRKLKMAVDAVLGVRPPYHMSICTLGAKIAEKLEIAVYVGESAVVVTRQEADFMISLEGIP